MRNYVAAGLIVAAVAVIGPPVSAQADDRALDVPAIAGGWVLRIVTRGGIMGQGAGDIVIASDGRLSCSGNRARCAGAIAVESLRSLHEQVRLASGEAWQGVLPATICSDCLTTTLVLTSRNADGTLTTASATWDPTTRGTLSAHVVRVRDIAAQLAQPPLTR